MPRLGGAETILRPQHYPNLQSIHFALAQLVRPRDFVAPMLSSITSASKLSEVSFIFTREVLSTNLDVAVSLIGWDPVDGQLRRLAQQAKEGLTTSFDLLTCPGWTPRGDDIGMRFMRKFRESGVMKLRRFGEDVAMYCSRA